MRRRELITGGAAAALGLVMPAAGFARQRGGGYKTIPYTPVNAYPYYAPGEELNANWDKIDAKIRPVVRSVNRSGWVWTAESCQGRHRWSFYPMLRLVCRTKDLGDLMVILTEAQAPNDDLHSGTKLRIVKVRSPRGWAEIRVFAPDIAFFLRASQRMIGESK